MKPSLLLALFAASIFLSACETRVVTRRPVVYRRTVYRDARPYDRYRDERVIYVAPGQTNRDFPRRSLDRTYAF